MLFIGSRGNDIFLFKLEVAYLSNGYRRRLKTLLSSFCKRVPVEVIEEGAIYI
jgi:hypothetical protein